MVVKMEIRHQPTTSSIYPIPHPSVVSQSAEWLPQLVPLTSPSISSLSDSKYSSELLIPGRVTASGSIPQGAMTVQIEACMLGGRADIQQVSVGVTTFGTLDLDMESKDIWTQNVHWLRAIRLADDCHSYNVQLKFTPSYRLQPNLKGGGGVNQPKLILQAVRPIEAGQELQLWFSEDILAMLGVVFLNPTNIQGEKKYRCTRCSSLYESPNPLKLHITLACGKVPISDLWTKLASLMKEATKFPNPLVSDFQFKLSPEPQLVKQTNAIDLTVGGHTNVIPNIPLMKREIYRPFAESSAFKPFKKSPLEINGNMTVPPLPLNAKHLSNVSTLWPIDLETEVVQLHRNLMQHTQILANSSNVYSDDAQIESLVSSLGKAKQGHICLYCGKCYSRKYGLKIHIRTHTGYKPLKCKYCDRPFGDPSNLNKHVRLHAEGNTPYKCDLCGKILVRRRDLERHLKSRHMMMMHPEQNIIPSSPVPSLSEDNTLSSTLSTESVETNNTKDSHQDAKSETGNTLEKLDEDSDYQFINVQKKEILVLKEEIKIS